MLLSYCRRERKDKERRKKISMIIPNVMLYTISMEVTILCFSKDLVPEKDVLWMKKRQGKICPIDTTGRVSERILSCRTFSMLIDSFGSRF